VFSWRWWFGVALSILPWIVWSKIRDKEDTVRELFIGLVVMLFTVSLDNAGLALDLWHYDYKILPIANMSFPWDYTLFPVGVMLILQFNPKINVYVKALSFAFITAFIFEPFFVWVGMYRMLLWKHCYSFVVYFPLYLFFNYIYKSKLFNK